MTEPFDRAAIKARAEKATPGPWETTQAGDEETTTWIEHQRGDVLHHDERGYGHMRENFSWMKRADAEFIAHAREDIPALLAALEEAEQEVERLRVAESQRNLYRGLIEEQAERADEAERRIAAVVTEAEAIRADYIAFWGAHSSSDIERVGRSPRMPKTPALDRERAALHPVAETTESEKNDE